MKQTALLVIDVQQGFDIPVYWGERNNPDAEQQIARLIAAWRKKKQPVIHVQHSSTEPNSPLRRDQPGYKIKPEAEPLPDEAHFVKNVNSAFIGTELEAYLHAQQITDLVIVGLTTDHCVSTSVRMAANLDFAVTLVHDATATFDRIGPDGMHYTAEEIHKLNLVSLNGEFCEVCSTEQLLADLNLTTGK